MTKRKIRFRTWYWGNFVLEGEGGFTLEQDGFELYDEEKHGWHNSDEFKAVPDVRDWRCIHGGPIGNPCEWCEKLMEGRKVVDVSICVECGEVGGPPKEQVR